MFRTIAPTRDLSRIQRLLAVVAFTGITAIGAQLEVQIGEFVPFTLQVFGVVLAGMVLGARDGALSQLLYVLLIRLNLPVAAGGAGAAALMGPTAGYLIAFIPAAFVVGWLVEQGAQRAWQRWLAGIVGIAIIYACGVIVLKSVTGLDWAAAWAAGVAPFIVFDLVKSALASTLTEGVRAFLQRR